MSDSEKFKQLHHGDGPLLLANAWNVKSAQLIEKAGFKAIATSSGAIAASMGYADGEKMAFEEVLYIVKKIKACTGIPLTVDLERGYTDDLNVLNKNIQSLLDCGVAGINLEDAQGEDIYLKKLESINNYLIKTNQQLFVNARTDVFLQKLPDPLETTLKRAIRYQNAGANGLFVTGVSDPATIKHIAGVVMLPLNIVATQALNTVEAIANCGVKRISMAGFLFGATYKQLGQTAQQILATGSYSALF